MGCCISKCKPKKNSIQDINLVQDKLVIISQPPKNPKTPISIPTSNKITPIISPPSPTTSSTSSISSFTCTNNSSNGISTSTISSSSSTSSGSSSSISTLKDRSFSNEFLWSCIKENPHVIRINSIKECSQFLTPPNVHSRKLESPVKNYSIPQKLNKSTPQKRIRSDSPTPLNRQKSFRREAERINSLHSLPLKSPSASRRFNGRGFSIKENGSKPMVSNCKVNDYSVSSLSSRKENHRNPRSCLKNNRQTCIHRISSKINEVAVQQALAQHDSESVPMEEDIDNPLISLDCFIFL
ncbi:hypothetical protein JCGZ_12183 [Jatropha curcas]|uniref:Uncharacterized protein n=1 Tax=Jatropha curcas TaxID=180498 RepID=A0A067K9I2_JATCU|nr:putative protein TPRXL [Jatropha curcas]KDP32891.1 hypothetical protein JCGZ_12183 [Jatropha curcas]